LPWRGIRWAAARKFLLTDRAEDIAFFDLLVACLPLGCHAACLSLRHGHGRRCR